QDDSQPLLKITAASGLRVSGFTLDGQNRLRDLVVLTGACPGLLLEDLHLTGFRESGVALRNCAGEPARFVILQRLRIAPSSSAMSAVHFDSQGEEVNRFVRVTDCRLEGPCQAAVVLFGRTADIELVGNRVFGTTDGIVY